MTPLSKASPAMEECISNCLDCYALCLETASHRLKAGIAHSSAAQHQMLLQDCAQACLTAANFMIRMSDYHGSYCSICAEICKACAADCEQMINGDKSMEDCAEACRRCAQSCRQMAKMASGDQAA